MTESKKRLVVAFSLANLCLYLQWANLELHTSSLLYRYENASPFPQTYIAMLLNLLLLGTFFWSVLRFGVESKLKVPRLLGQGCFFVGILLGINSFRAVIRSLMSWRWLSVGYLKESLGTEAFVILALVLSLGGFYVLIRKNALVLKTAQVFLTLIFPLALFNGAWTVRNLVTDNYGGQLKPKPISKKEHKQRVVWIIFDTLEQRSTFTARPKGLELPHLDALKRQSVYGSNVYSPGARTHYSLASYLTGKVVRLGYAAHGNDSRLYFKGEDQQYLLGQVPTLFDRARSLGHKTALVGWYHPYCRMLRHSLDRCEYHSLNQPLADQPVPDVLASMGIFLRQMLPLKKPVPGVEGYKYLANAAIDLASSSDYGMVFLHLTIPHPPWVYDRKTGEVKDVDSDPRDQEGFFSNVKLTDITLGKIKAAMKERGVWENTTLLVSSDHWWWFGGPDNQVYRPDGTDDFRIPFLLKMAGQKKTRSLKTPFNAVLAHYLMLDVLKGDVEDPNQVVDWINERQKEFSLDPVMETNIFG